MSAQPTGFDGYHGYVGVQRRGLIALPADLRQRLHLHEPGAQPEITERPTASSNSARHSQCRLTRHGSGPSGGSNASARSTNT